MLHLCRVLLWRHVLSDLLFEAQRNVGSEGAPCIFRPIRPEISLRRAIGSLVYAEIVYTNLLCF
jgi:hypothetical protein